MSDYKSYQRHDDDEIEIDLQKILAIFKKWSKMIIVMSLLCVFAAGLISYFVLSPIYQASTLLVTNATDKTMNTYLAQLKSDALMELIIKELELNPGEYTPTGLSGMIEASIVNGSNLIEVKVNNGDPVTASKIANTLADQYLQLIAKNQKQLSRSVTFFENQKKTTDEQLSKTEKDLKEIQSQPRSVPVLEIEFLKKTEDLMNYESRLKMIQVEIRQTISGINQLQMELGRIPKTITAEKWTMTGSVSIQETNPIYVSTAQELSENQVALAAKEGEAEGLADLVNTMRGDLDSLQAELVGKRLAQDKLQREVNRLKQTSETLAEKGTEKQIAKSMEIEDTSVMVISKASVPVNPIKPNKKLNMTIAFILGLMIFTLLAFILEKLDNTPETPEDIKRELA